jgi:septum formation protein
VTSIVLASASPARRKLLAAAGLEPSIVVSDVDEEAVTAAARATYGELVAEDVADQIDDAVIIGCDSVLDLDGEIHGKPASAAVANSRWHQMRGRSGILHTGHWLVDTRAEADGGTGATLGATASTTVHFAKLSDDEIDAYVATGEPLRVAGAFTLDGLGAPFVTGIEGDPSNVVGLSLPLLRELLLEVGLAWHELRSSAHQGAQGRRDG